MNNDHLTQRSDPSRIAVAGISAGAATAALLATRHPERLRSIAVHPVLAPGDAHCSATSLRALIGRRIETEPAATLTTGDHLPALLVIHGSDDDIVEPRNGVEAGLSCAASDGAKPGAVRTGQRSARYVTKFTDYRTRCRLVASLCDVIGLGHTWSGGPARQAYRDLKGPDASPMIRAFIVRQFATARA